MRGWQHIMKGDNMIRGAIWTAGLGVLLVAGNLCAAEKPNLIFILADDMGYSDPGFLGGDIQTPNLDRMANQGTVFSRFYNHGKCEPSRASLITGVHFHRQTYDHVLRSFRGVSTIAEQLKSAGYYTACAGKWHVPDEPTDHGFDHYFGLLGGAGSHLDPDGRLGLDEKYYLFKNYRLDGKPFPNIGKPFYSADAATDYAIRFLKDCPDDKPFFLYLAYRTPHWPLQAPAENIKKYEHHYDQGWDVMRRERYMNLLKSGVIDKTWKLSPRDKNVCAWDEWPNKEDSARCMEVHAAMVDRMDQQIGRVLGWLEANGKLDNTLICFTSDNGVSAETNFDRTPQKFAGSVDSFRQIPAGFSNAINTPLMKYKTWNSNGGICSPMIAFWPQKIPSGRVEDSPISILDIMPTFMDIAGAVYPGNLRPLDGRSILPLLTGSEEMNPVPLFFQLKYGNEVDQKAVIDWPWKAWFDAQEGWKMFNLACDASETDNLAGAYPEILQRMISKYAKFDAAALQDQKTYGQEKMSK